MVASRYRGLPSSDWLSRVDVVLAIQCRTTVIVIHETIGLDLANSGSVEGILLDIIAQD